MADLSDLVGFALTLTTRNEKDLGGMLIFDSSSAKQIFTQKFGIALLPNRTQDKLKGRCFFSWHSIEDPFKIQVLTAK